MRRWTFTSLAAMSARRRSSERAKGDNAAAGTRRLLSRRQCTNVLDQLIAIVLRQSKVAELQQVRDRSRMSPLSGIQAGGEVFHAGVAGEEGEAVAAFGAAEQVDGAVKLGTGGVAGEDSLLAREQAG